MLTCSQGNEVQNYHTPVHCVTHSKRNYSALSEKCFPLSSFHLLQQHYFQRDLDAYEDRNSHILAVLATEHTMGNHTLYTCLEAFSYK